MDEIKGPGTGVKRSADRAYIPLAEKLAAALGALFEIPYEHARHMTAEQVISLVHFDHYPVRYGDGGPNAHYNLVPRLIEEHRWKTAKVDKPAQAKSDRLSAAHEEFRRKILAKGEEPKRPRKGWGRRRSP